LEDQSLFPSGKGGYPSKKNPQKSPAAGDLFQLLGHKRPDFRWLLLGHKGSGSKWHLDPSLGEKKMGSKILQEIGGGIWATPKKKHVANFSLR